MRTIRQIADLCAMTVVAACIQSASAQNWRPPNPNQPNGYRASEAASHSHGDAHLPAQEQNGYHASEARSHYGGQRDEPASGWNYENNSGPGSAFSNDNYSNYDSMPGSAYSSARWEPKRRTGKFVLRAHAESKPMAGRISQPKVRGLCSSLRFNQRLRIWECIKIRNCI